MDVSNTTLYPLHQELVFILAVLAVVVTQVLAIVLNLEVLVIPPKVLNQVHLEIQAANQAVIVAIHQQKEATFQYLYQYHLVIVIIMVEVVFLQ